MMFDDLQYTNNRTDQQKINSDECGTVICEFRVVIPYHCDTDPDSVPGLFYVIERSIRS